MCYALHVSFNFNNILAFAKNILSGIRISVKPVLLVYEEHGSEFNL